MRVACSFVCFAEHKSAVARAKAVETEVQHLTECIVEATAGRLGIKQEEADGLVRDLDECAASINKEQVGKKAADRFVFLKFAKF